MILTDFVNLDLSLTFINLLIRCYALGVDLEPRVQLVADLSDALGCTSDLGSSHRTVEWS